MNNNFIMENPSDSQIQCPNCHMMNCYETKYNELSVFLCFNCGFTTNTKMELGSKYVEEYFVQSKNVAQFIKDLHFDDLERKLVWYPTVLQFPNLGVIYPEPLENDWCWAYVKEIPILEGEREKFKIDGTDEYYKTKLDIDNTKYYNKYNFYSACIDAGIINQL